MSADQLAVAYVARPRADEVLVANLPAGAALTVHYPDGTVRTFEPVLPDTPLIVAVPGDVELLGWGAYVVHYATAHQIRNGHNRIDRPVWHQAERAVRDGGIVYLRHARREYYGRERWTAAEVRREAER